MNLKEKLKTTKNINKIKKISHKTLLKYSKYSVFFLFLFLLFVFIQSFPEINSHFRVKDFTLSFDSSSKLKSFEPKLKKDLKESLKEFKNHLIWKVNLSQISEKLEKNQWVNKVSIQRRFPNQLSLKVQVLPPLLSYISEKGTIYYITEKGDFIPHTFVWDAPILRGKIFQKRKDLLKKAIQFIEHLPSKGIFSQSQISDISYNQKRGFVLYLIQPKVEVRLGSNPFQNKSRHLEYVLEYLNAKGLQARVIDARFSKKVVVSLKNQA